MCVFACVCVISEFYRQTKSQSASNQEVNVLQIFTALKNIKYEFLICVDY